MTQTVTTQTQQKWEYCLVTRKTEPALLGECNRLGQEGWELVDVLFYKDLKGVMCWTSFLKRRSTGESPMPAGPAAALSSEAAKETPPSLEGFDLGDADFEFKAE
jgi:hypothetical protein